MNPIVNHPVAIGIEGGRLDSDLVVPPGAAGLVIFGHGSGSSRQSRRNRTVAERLQRAGLATLLSVRLGTHRAIGLTMSS